MIFPFSYLGVYVYAQGNAMKARVFVISVGTTFLVAGAFGVAAFMLGHCLQRFLNGETDV